MPQTSTHTYREEKVPTTGGLQVFVRSWRPEAPARAIVAIVHGFNSHSGHYLWVGEQLAASGFAVYAVDLRGRGQSDGERFYIEQVTEYLDDVDDTLDLLRSRGVEGLGLATEQWRMLDDGREHAGRWLAETFHRLGRETTVDLDRRFL